MLSEHQPYGIKEKTSIDNNHILCILLGAKQQSMEFNVAALELAGLLVMYGGKADV